MTSFGDDADAPEIPADAVEVGRIGEAWGVKGWFRVQPYAGDPQALFSSKRWYLKAPPAAAMRRAAATGPLPRLLRIVEARSHADGVVARAHDVEDRRHAEALRGALICISRSSFPSAGDDEYYWIDLIGLDVVNRQEQLLGRVVGLLDTGPHAVLRIAPPAAGSPTAADEVLIPFVSAYVDSVSLDDRRICVDWGLDFGS